MKKGNAMKIRDQIVAKLMGSHMTEKATSEIFYSSTVNFVPRVEVSNISTK